MVRRIFLLFLFLPLFNSLLYSQDENEITNRFKKALKLYDSKNYQQAYNIFNDIANDSAPNSKTTISILFKGKTLVQLNKLKEAESTLKTFIESYPSSNYLDEAHLTLAKAFYEDKNYPAAFNELLSLIENSRSLYFINYAKASGEKIAQNYLLPSDLNRIYDKSTNIKSKPYLLLLLAKININEGDLLEAKQDLNGLVQNYPDSEEKGEAALLNLRIQNSKNNGGKNSEITSTLIGVLLPLKNENINAETSADASQILEGIKYAVSEYNDRNINERVGLLIRNTGRDQSKIDSIKGEFEDIPQIKAIIGPIFSDEVKMVINDFKDMDVPIISPTATDTGLTQLSDNFFQANPPFSLRGKIIADYIYYNEKKNNIGVLYSIDGYSSMLASTFTDEFKALGGIVPVSSSYKSGSLSLNDPISKLTELKNKIQGLYIPLSDKVDAPVIFSQLIQNEIIVPIYGNQDWFYAKGYESASALSNQLVFSSDFFIDYSDSTFLKFSKDFLNKTNFDANRNTLYGYDSAEYLLTVLENSTKTRKAIKMKMESGLVTRGFHNDISFYKDHINKYLNIIAYKDGKFQLLEKFKSKN